jgi:hypothetical protein
MQGKPDIRDLMASVGYLLLYWGLLEKGLKGGPLPAEAEPVRQMRNAICHGMEAARADPDDDREAHIRCRTASGAVVTYSADDLDKAVGVLAGIGGRYAGS